MSDETKLGLVDGTVALFKERDFRYGLLHALVWGLLTGPIVSFLISGGLSEPVEWWTYVGERWTVYVWALPLVGATWAVMLTISLSFFRWVVIPRIDLGWSGARQLITITGWSMLLGFVSIGAIHGILKGVFGISAMPTTWSTVAAVVGLVGIVIGNLFFLSHQNQLRLQEEERRREEMERFRMESELMNLNMRIRPHFFFNALNTLSSLMDKDTERAQAFLVDLADLFRMSFAHGREDHTTTWAEERALLATYLQLERGRFGARLETRIEVAADDRDPFPAFLLQPLIENAIHHGIARMKEPGEIVLTGSREGDQWRLRISNDTPERVTPSFPEGHALAQIRDRLALMDGGLEIEVEDNRFTLDLHWQQRRRDNGTKE